MIEPRIPIAREGYPFIAFMALTTLVTAITGGDNIFFQAASAVFLILTGFVLYFFRDPERVTPEAADALISPADGKIIIIEKIFDEKFLKKEVYKVSIFMNVFNVHVNRVPLTGKVLKVQYSPGAFFSADSNRGALENEYCAITMENEKQQQFTMVQVAGLIARRIVCWAVKDDTLARGERFGLIRFGSRVDLYLPEHIQLEISKGQKVKAGETILGYLE
jgi:phosphatidylserine decarboxylase